MTELLHFATGLCLVCLAVLVFAFARLAFLLRQETMLIITNLESAMDCEFDSVEMEPIRFPPEHACIRHTPIALRYTMPVQTFHAETCLGRVSINPN